MASLIKGKTLVRGDGVKADDIAARPKCTWNLLHSTVSLSFWGGIDPVTSTIIDHAHPLHGQSVADTVLAIPSGRGSCTGSQVLLELILNGIAPRAIVTRDVDPILCVGAIIAEEVFGDETSCVPTIISLGREGFDELAGKSYANIICNGDGTLGVVAGSSREDMIEIGRINKSSASSIQQTGEEALKDINLSTLQLSKEETSILEGRRGTAADQIAFRTICRIASMTSAPKLIPVTQAHIDGCTYIGPGGLRFVEKLVELGGKVRIPTTLNSQSTDRRRWAALGVSSDLASPANKVGSAYLELGCTESFTCAPYLLPSKPGLGEDIVWGESNAVVYSNSVLGARTDKVADYFDICAALIGRVPLHGVHLANNRRPGIVIDIRDVVDEHILPLTEDTSNDQETSADLDAFFPILGYLIGTLSDGLIPIVLGMEGLSEYITEDDLKSFCAAFGTTGTAPLVHIAQITPEAMDHSTIEAMVDECEGRIERITHRQLVDSYRLLNRGVHGEQDERSDKVDLVAFGNPHLSLHECERLAKLVQKKKRIPTSELWLRSVAIYLKPHALKDT